VRAALAWAVAYDAEVALRLCAALSLFWIVSRAAGEGYAWAARALALPGAADSPAYAKALLAAGRLVLLPADPAAARPWLEPAVAALRAQRPVHGALLGRALAYLAAAIALAEGHEAARETSREGLALLRTAGDEAGLAEGLFVLAQVALFWGDLPAGRAALEESRALYRRQGNRLGLAQAAAALGDLARIAGDHRAAQLHNLAYVALAVGEVAWARALLGEVRVIGTPLGAKPALARADALAARLEEGGA
jgi:hypothetical protein